MNGFRKYTEHTLTLILLCLTDAPTFWHLNVIPPNLLPRLPVLFHVQTTWYENKTQLLKCPLIRTVFQWGNITAPGILIHCVFCQMQMSGKWLHDWWLFQLIANKKKRERERERVGGRKKFPFGVKLKKKTIKTLKTSVFNQHSTLWRLKISINGDLVYNIALLHSLWGKTLTSVYN